MTSKKIIFLLCGVVIFFTACEEDKAITYSGGSVNAISQLGSGGAYVGGTQTYYIPVNVADYDYSWQIGAGATVTERTDNDAFVDVAFTTPGSYTLSVSNNVTESTGETSILATSRWTSLALESPDMLFTEGLENDTISIPLSIAGGFNGNFSYAYTITGDMVAGTDYTVVAGYESPITASVDSLTEIKLVLWPDNDNDAADTLSMELELTTVTPVLAEEYVLDTASAAVFTASVSIVDDMKEVAINTDTVALTEAGIYTYPVTLSNPHSDDVTVTYTVTGGGADVEDATVSDVPGQLTLAAGEQAADIVLSIKPNAFSSDKMVVIDLTTVTSADSSTEVSLDTDMDQKVLEITAPE